MSSVACLAGDLDIHVILSAEVAPGVYGQVQIGSDRPPPPLVYAQPMLIEPQAAPPPPVYLHVPPGHAKDWSKHCREYHACNRPVYFVRSEEYEPGYVYRNDARGHERDHEHDRVRHEHEDRSRHEDEDRSRHDEHEHGHGHDEHERHDGN
jgi:hypothetical protein